MARGTIIILGGDTGKAVGAQVVRSLDRAEGREAAGFEFLVVNGPIAGELSTIPDGTVNDWRLETQPGVPYFHQLTADQRREVDNAKQGKPCAAGFLVASDAKALPTDDSTKPENGFGRQVMLSAVSAELGYKTLAAAVSQRLTTAAGWAPEGGTPLAVIVTSTAGATGLGHAPYLRRAVRDGAGGDFRRAEVIVLPLAYDTPDTVPELAAAGTIAGLRRWMRERAAGETADLTLVVGVPPKQLVKVFPREGVLSSLAGFLEWLVRDETVAVEEFVQWTTATSNLSPSAALCVPGFAGAGLPAHAWADVIAAEITSELYDAMAPDDHLIDRRKVKQITSNLLSGEGLLGRISGIALAPGSNRLGELQLSDVGAAYDDDLKSFDPSSGVSFPEVPQLAQIVTLPRLRLLPDQVTAEVERLTTDYLGDAQRRTTGLARALDVLSRIVAEHAQSVIRERCAARLDRETAPRSLADSPAIGLEISLAAAAAAHLCDHAAERIEQHRDQELQPGGVNRLEGARRERSDAQEQLRAKPNRSTARVFLDSAQQVLHVEGWLMTVDAVAGMARDLAGAFREMHGLFDDWVTRLRTARYAADERARRGRQQMKYDDSRPVFQVLPARQEAREALLTRAGAGPRDKALADTALRLDTAGAKARLLVRHPGNDRFEPVMLRLDEGLALFIPSALSAWVKAQVLPALRALNLADVITLDIQAAASDSGGEITDGFIDRWIEKLLATIEQRAEPLAMPVRDTFRDSWDRLLLDRRPSADSSDPLAKRVSERLDRMTRVTGFQQGATPAVYGAAVLRVRLGLGIELDSLKGYSTLYDKYHTFNEKRVTGADDWRPVHTTLADRNAHLIEWFLVAADRLRRPRPLCPGVTDLLEAPDIVRLVARLHALKLLPVNQPADPSHPAMVVVELPAVIGSRKVSIANEWDLAEVCRRAMADTEVHAALQKVWHDHLEHQINKLGSQSAARKQIEEEVRTAADGFTIPAPPTTVVSDRAEREDLGLVMWALLVANDQFIGIEAPPA